MKKSTRFFVNCYHTVKFAQEEALINAIATNTELPAPKSKIDLILLEKKREAIQYVEVVDCNGNYLMPPKFVEALSTASKSKM